MYNVLNRFLLYNLTKGVILSDYFSQQYTEIIKPISQELEAFDNFLCSFFKNEQIKKNEIIPIIKDFLNTKGKRIRPAIIFLMAKALDQKIDKLHYNLALTTELIHNATLIHDDIIDCSLIRRGKNTINFDYDSKLAVLAGDFLLAKSINILNSIGNTKIHNIYSQTITHLINGELNQYFNRFKISTLEDYIEKSKNKTARLFEAGLVSTFLVHDKTKFIENVRDFALNFGIAFQIHNDLKNVQIADKVSDDIKNGDYSAPIIFYTQENNLKTMTQTDKLIKSLKKSSALEKTQNLIDFYVDKAIENISFIEDNLYKQALINLCILYKNY